MVISVYKEGEFKFCGSHSVHFDEFLLLDSQWTTRRYIPEDRTLSEHTTTVACPEIWCYTTLDIDTVTPN
jgi:hypothetical protein